jgi:hypothetical protein
LVTGDSLEIITLAAGPGNYQIGSNYSNANVASYLPYFLPTYSGNIQVSALLPINPTVSTIGDVGRPFGPIYTANAITYGGVTGASLSATAGVTSLVNTQTGQGGGLIAGDILSGNITANSLYSIGDIVGGDTFFGNLNVSSNAAIDNSLTVLGPTVTSNISASGNITANYYFGNGVFLSGVQQYSDSRVAAFLPTYSGNIRNIQLTKFNEAVVNGGSINGTVVPDINLASIYNYTLVGNITLNTITNITAGSSMTIILKQDATGNRQLTSSWLFAGNTRTLSTQANSTDIIFVFYSGSQYYASLAKGYS